MHNFWLIAIQFCDFKFAELLADSELSKKKSCISKWKCIAESLWFCLYNRRHENSGNLVYKRLASLLSDKQDGNMTV